MICARSPPDVIGAVVRCPRWCWVVLAVGLAWCLAGASLVGLAVAGASSAVVGVRHLRWWCVVCGGGGWGCLVTGGGVGGAAGGGASGWEVWGCGAAAAVVSGGNGGGVTVLTVAVVVV